jgi:hypothetical protein
MAYFWGFRLLWSFLAHTLFEVVENTEAGIQFINKNLAGIWPGGKPRADSLFNIYGDSVAFVVGWGLAYKLDLLGLANDWY